MLFQSFLIVGWYDELYMLYMTSLLYCVCVHLLLTLFVDSVEGQIHNIYAFFDIAELTNTLLEE